ncbi:hypothetical protein [Thiohalorhabdus sp.]|uniref:hypothetical protein n=1 Tax=Thiohalorhabdus sp. TaxID=3094134 RepID=UPI002FC3696F
MERFDPRWLDNPESLESLIGCRAEYAGEPFSVIEILPDGPQLVLQHRDRRAIQQDMQGRPYRRVPETVCLELLDDHGQPSPQLELLLVESP